MDKKQFIDNVVDLLASRNIRKPVSALRSVLHISDDTGQSHDFIIKKPATALLYSRKDITKIVDACMDVISDAMQRGEEISVYSFGKLKVHYRAPRNCKHPVTHEPINIDESYTVKFTPGGELRRSAKLYALKLKEQKEGERLGNY